MKMLKTGKNNWCKWIIVVFICYLLASYGVNQTINPKVYFAQGMQEEIAVLYKGDHVTIDIPENKSSFKYLNIVLGKINIFETTVEVTYGYSNREDIQEKLLLCNRKNGFELQEFGKDITSLSFEKAILDKYEIIIDKVFMSENQPVDILKMLEIWFSFIGVTGVYSFMQWIKKRYAK